MAKRDTWEWDFATIASRRRTHCWFVASPRGGAQHAPPPCQPARDASRGALQLHHARHGRYPRRWQNSSPTRSGRCRSTHGRGNRSRTRATAVPTACTASARTAEMMAGSRRRPETPTATTCLLHREVSLDQDLSPSLTSLCRYASSPGDADDSHCHACSLVAVAPTWAARLEAPVYPVPEDNAFDHYLRATELFPEARPWDDAVDRLDGMDPAEAEVIVLDAGAALEEFRAGVGKDCVMPGALTSTSRSISPTLRSSAA